MRSILALLLALVVSACTFDAIDDGGQVDDGSPSTTLIVTTTVSAPGSTVAPVIPSTTIDLDDAKAIVTPTGVVVAVVAHTPEGIVVTSPCGVETVVSTGIPIGNIQVVLDPGHGGEIDTGAVGSNGLTEKEINLKVASAVEAKLRDLGVGVVLTRTGDYATTLGVRADLADALEPELLLSIHHNAPTPQASSHPGTEVFVQSESDQSHRLGALVWEHVVDALSHFDIPWAAAPDSGVLEVHNTRGTDAYGMIRGPETVSALAELAYISHSPEAELFTTPEYVEAASQAVADSIVDYLETEQTGSGLVAEPRVFTPQRGISGDVCVDPVLE
jgi:N-acetylmuramoyl-L-alanine amidase